MNRKEKVLSFWDKLKPTLESMILKPDADVMDRLEKKELLTYLPSVKGKDVLELGAGIGRYTSHFALKANHVTTSDIVPKFIEKSKEHNAAFSNISYIAEDAMKLEFSKEKFDFIFINWLFMFLEDDEVEHLTNKFLDWLKPDGIIFFRESCNVPERRRTDHYYANYRNFHFYTRTFSKKFTLLKHDNIKNSEIHFSDPFQCFWLFQKAASVIQ